MDAMLIITLPDGTTKTLQLSAVSVATQLNLNQPLPNEPGAPVVPVTVLHLHGEVVSGSL